MCIFHKLNYFFIHLKLEIASAIPASNEWKILTNNSAAQGLNRMCHITNTCWWSWWKVEFITFLQIAVIQALILYKGFLGRLHYQLWQMQNKKTYAVLVYEHDNILWTWPVCPNRSAADPVTLTTISYTQQLCKTTLSKKLGCHETETSFSIAHWN